MYELICLVPPYERATADLSVKMRELRHREFKSLVPVSVEEPGFKPKQSGFTLGETNPLALSGVYLSLTGRGRRNGQGTPALRSCQSNMTRCGALGICMDSD